MTCLSILFDRWREGCSGMVWVRLSAVLALFMTVAFTATASIAGEDTGEAAATKPSAPSAPEFHRPSPRASPPVLEKPATSVTTSPPATTHAPAPTAAPGHTDAPPRPTDPESARAH